MRGKIATIPYHGLLVCALSCALLAGGCGGEEMEQPYMQSSAFEEISTASWERLAGKRIFFGHQSVGAGIVDGLAEIAAERDAVTLNIVEGAPAGGAPAPVFLHAPIGANGEPAGKLSRFGELLLGDLGDTIDIAFFKLCYSDITADTDVPRLFAQYQQQMARIKEARPNITFMHVTVPLTAIQTGPKAFIKRLLKKPLGGYADNAKRNEFNLLMRLAYAGREPFFDLALLESTRPDGSRAIYTVNDKQHYSLAAAYTDDGGHLNAAGKRLAAEQLLILLTQL